MEKDLDIAFGVLFAVVFLVAIAIAISFALSPHGDFYIAEKQLTTDGYVLCVRQKGFHFLFGEFTVINDFLVVDGSFYNLVSVGDIVAYDTTEKRIIFCEV